MEIMEQKTELQFGPREITPENVQYWSHHTQQFAHSQIHKAKKFLEHQCYEYVGEGMFLCNNIPGYNSRIYHIKKSEHSGEFACDCQFSKDENDGHCSHILGLYYAFKCKYFQKNKSINLREEDE